MSSTSTSSRSRPQGPYLEDGGEIAASATDVPKTLASTVVAINTLLKQIDADQLHTILNETSIALKGTGDDINRTIDQGQLLLDDVEGNWPATDRLLRNGGEVLDIGTQNEARIAAFAKDSRQFAAFLKAYNPELVKTLHAAPKQIKTVDNLTNEVAKHLPGFLGSATEITDVFAKHDPHLRALLAGYSPGPRYAVARDPARAPCRSSCSRVRMSRVRTPTPARRSVPGDDPDRRADEQGPAAAPAMLRTRSAVR